MTIKEQELLTIAESVGAEITDFIDYAFANDVILFHSIDELMLFANKITESNVDVGSLNNER